MKAAKWSGAGESNVNDKTTGISTTGIKTTEISRHSRGPLAQEVLAKGGLAHARLLDGSDFQAEMLHTRMQSINFQQAQIGFQQAQNGPVSIARHFADHNSTDHRDENMQSFSAQSVWSYLHDLPVEAKLK